MKFSFAEARFITLVICACSVLLLLAAPARAQQLTPAWVEVGPGGAAVARVVVATASDCPTILIDGTSHPMAVRQPLPPGFRPACEFAIPLGSKKASVGSQTLVLSVADPTRVIAFGDTGCRIKGSNVQDCDNPDHWPLQRNASQAAAEKPQLMIHVGDYLYRESPCPADLQSLCGGSPAGDNWDAWNADFFTPAAKLLAATPWAFSRGNHEDCTRSWRGWFYYLDPRPWDGKCAEYSPAYVVHLGKFELVMLDSSAVSELSADKDQVAAYVGQLLSVHAENAWLVDHHPFWAFAPTVAGFPPIPISAPLEEAWNTVHPTGISMILSGHIHLFEFVTVDAGRPDQLVVGDGGTTMASPIKGDYKGLKVRGITIAGNEMDQKFGYTLFTKSDKGWNVLLKSVAGEPLISCAIPGGDAPCKNLAANPNASGTRP